MAKQYFAVRCPSIAVGLMATAVAWGAIFFRNDLASSTLSIGQVAPASAAASK